MDLAPRKYSEIKTSKFKLQIVPVNRGMIISSMVRGSKFESSLSMFLSP